jgi:cysteine desulfurase/selenocysteine lyase
LRLVSLVGVSNVDGVAFPIPAIARRVHEAGALLMLDAAQSAAHQHVTLQETGADLVALSLHKMLGPSGVGALVATSEAWDTLGPWQLGGGTVSASGPEGYDLLARPARYEAGLGNFAGLVAVAPALDYLSGIGFDAIAGHDRRLNDHATRLLADIPGVTVHGPAAAQRSSIVPFTVDGLDPHDVALYLDEAADVSVRSGAHCVHSYFARRGMTGTVRASFHAYNTTQDVDRMAEALTALVASMRPRTRPGREK